MLKVFTDFNSRSGDGACWNLRNYGTVLDCTPGMRHGNFRDGPPRDQNRHFRPKTLPS
jgi:hypothetical protein